MKTSYGQSVAPAFKDLAEEMTYELGRAGPNSTVGLSMYGCHCSFLDTASQVGKAEIITNILPAFHKDRVRTMPANSEFGLIQMALYGHSYFVENGVLEKSLDDLIEWAGPEMSNWSLPEITVVHLAVEYLESPLLGMALAQGKANVGAAALGFCAAFWRERMESLVRSSLGRPGPTIRFAPVRDSVSTHASTTKEGDETEQIDGRISAWLRSRCRLNVLRRFAASGRSLPVGQTQSSK